MAAIFCDSFDHSTTADLTAKWTQVTGSPTVNTTGGRRSGGAAAIGLGGAGLFCTPTAPLPSGNTFVMGVAVKKTTGSFGGDEGVQVCQTAGSTNARLRINSDGTISVHKGGTTFCTSTFALQVNVWAYIELKVVIHASAGSVEARVNNVTWCSASSVNTQAGATATWNGFGLGGGGVFNGLFDDVYVIDGSGTDNHTFLGDSRVDVIVPTAAGSSSQFTRSAGSDQWATIDDATPNGDTDYNESSTAGQRDLLNFPNAPVTGASIRFLQGLAYAKKTDAGAAGLKIATRIGSTNYDGTELSLQAGTYAYVRQIWGTKPSDGTAWVDTDVNAAEFGYLKST